MDTKSAMLRFKTRTKETGQALVLIAMLVVILLAFLGLAIDGGGMFLLWRDAQNAVDTAALQAAFSYCTSNKDFQAAVDAGLNAANANGFNNNALDNWVTVEPAPAARHR
jgi:Flp pilus assembly protein TadG